jgi:hypothetical protein
MMKKIIKIIIVKFNNILNSIIAIFKVLVLSNFNSKVKNIKIVSIKECYVLGNGPSLKEAINNNSYLFLNQNLMVVNDFALSDSYTIFKPCFYVFADPGYWVDGANADVIEVRDKVFDIILSNTSWNIKVFIPYLGHKNGIIKSRLKNNNLIEIVYYNSASVEGFDFIKNNLYKFNMAMPSAQNVLIAAIFLAMNIGFKRVCVFGADHSWTENIIVNPENQVCLTDKHFYNTDNSKVKPWLKVSGEPYKMHEILYDLSNSFKKYHELKFYGNTIGAEIINYTSGSYIDAFVRAQK